MTADLTPDMAEGQDTVDLVIEDARWEGADLEALARRAVSATLAVLDRSDATVVVLGCDDARIAALNAQFRGMDKPTNVLSWPAEEAEPRDDGTPPTPPEAEEWGDIAISYDTCAAEAAAQGKPFADHVTHLLVHATLHLAGYDHEREGDAETMERAERSILDGLGIPDPYMDSAEAGARI